MADDLFRHPRYRFPPAIIGHAVWLYHRSVSATSKTSSRNAGITVRYETVRHWCQTFGLTYARRLRRRSGPAGNTWHLDELFVG